MTNLLRIPANSKGYLVAICDVAQDKFDVTKFVYNFAQVGGILRIPANSEIQLMAIRDSAADEFHVLDFTFPYVNAVAFPAAWAYWKFEEASGTRVDATGNGHDLPVVGGSPGNAAGKLGNALSGDLTDYIEKPEAWDPTNNVHFMFAFWAKIPDSGHLEINTNLGLFIEDYGAAVGLSAWTDSRYLDTEIGTFNEWHFIVLYYNGTGLYLEVDNAAIVNDPGESGFGSSYEETYIAFSGPGGLVDELGIWVGANADAALARRSELWNGGAGWSPY